MEERVRRYSHTSLSTFRRCRQRYKWKYVDNLRPLPTMGLVRGSVGHSTFASWYTDHDEDKAFKVASDELAKYEDKLQTSLEREWDLLATVFSRYFAWSKKHDDFKTEAIEQKFELEHEGNVIIGYIDGIVHRNDKTVWLLEHKFQKQARTSHLSLDPQVSIYIWAARAMGYDVRGVFYNVIRMAKGGIAEREPVVRLPVYRNNESLAYIVNELSVQMQEMDDFHAGRLATYRNPTRDCSWDCGFYGACMALNDNGRAESELESIPVQYYEDVDEEDDAGDD